MPGAAHQALLRDDLSLLSDHYAITIRPLSDHYPTIIRSIDSLNSDLSGIDRYHFPVILLYDQLAAGGYILCNTAE